MDSEMRSNYPYGQDFTLSDSVGNAVEFSKRLGELNQAVAARDDEVKGLTGALANCNGRAEKLVGLIAGRDGRIRELSGEVERLEGLIAGRDGRIRELSGEVEKLYNSTSWRVTAWLRYMRMWMRKVALMRKPGRVDES